MSLDPVRRLNKTRFGRTNLEFKLGDDTIVMILWRDNEIRQ